MYDFEKNHNFEKMLHIKAGDLVHLKSNDGLGYLLKCEVVEKPVELVNIRVVSAYTLDGSRIDSGHGAEFIGKSLNIEKELIFWPGNLLVGATASQECADL